MSRASFSLRGKFKELWDSPTGLKTTHTWGPLANWGFVIAGLLDTRTRAAADISLPMTSAMCIYSALFMRFALRVQPRNMLLFACHVCNEGVQLNQLRRYAGSRQLAVSDTDVGQNQSMDTNKARVVVLGSGWGAMTFLRGLDPSRAKTTYDVTLVSPRNYFLYTPLLPGAAAGTVEPRSLVDPVRRQCQSGNYLEAECIDVDPEKKEVTCRYPKDFRGFDKERIFKIPYDVLIVAVGAVTNTFGVPGVEENCFFLKKMEDAKRLRQRINECFEIASLPDTTPEERKQLLTFVVVGGGPTGVELTAEIHDLIQEDMHKYFPKLMGYVDIKLVDTMDFILSTFDRQIARYATQHFQRSGIDLVLQSMVKAVEPGAVVLRRRDATEDERIPFGTCIWTTGNKMHPLAKEIGKKLPNGAQEHSRALKTDKFLRVLGTGGSMYALGDVSTVSQEHALEHAAELFEEGDVDHDGKLNCNEILVTMRKASKTFPQLAEHAARMKCSPSSDFGKFMHDVISRKSKSSYDNVIATSDWLSDKDEDAEDKATKAAITKAKSVETLTLEEFKAQLAKIDKAVRPFPATAQVATQQGAYLGRLFNKYNVKPYDPAAPTASTGVPPEAQGFLYNHLGSLAYIGADRGVVDLGRSMDFGDEIGPFRGWLMGFAWKSFETFKQTSFKNMYLVSRDLLKTKIVGRDISDI